MYKLKGLIEGTDSCKIEINGKWVPARPEPYHNWRVRLKDAWAVFTKKADAVEWPEGQ